MSAILGRVASRTSAAASRLPGALARNSSKFWSYARVELMPPSPSEFGQVGKGFRNVVAGFGNGRWRQLSVKEAAINAAVAAECLFCFFIGECIGKGSVIGYAIPGAMHFEMIEGGKNSSDSYFSARYPDWKPPVVVDRDYDH